MSKIIKDRFYWFNLIKAVILLISISTLTGFGTFWVYQLNHTFSVFGNMLVGMIMSCCTIILIREAFIK